MNRELPDVQAGFRRGRGTRDQITSIHLIMEKARKFQKNIYLYFIDYAKAFVWITTNCGTFLKRWAYQNTLLVSSETCMQLKKQQLGFLDGPVVKNQAANTGDSGSTPALWRSHMLQSHWACAPQPLSLSPRAWKLQLPKLKRPKACALQEKPPQWEAHALQVEGGPRSLKLEQSPCSNKDPANPTVSK